jgi:hypothetical protein
MHDDTKQLLIIVIGIVLLCGMGFASCNVDRYLTIKQQDCQNISKYNNTLQHDINLKQVCEEEK